MKRPSGASRSRSRKLIVGVLLALASTAGASDDWQYWNQVVFKHEFNDRTAVDIASEQKWRDDASDFYLYNVFIVPTVKLTDNVSVGAGYRCERKEADDQWLTENRLLFPLTIGWAVKPWLLQWRTQPEYRDLENDQDRWRLRERILIKRPVQLGGLTVTPFVSEEIFYDFTIGQLDQNRAGAGVSVPWGERTTLTVYYMNRAEHAGDWSTAHVLGTELAFKF